MNEMSFHAFAKEALKKGLTFVSRFLDMPISDVELYTDSQLIQMIVHIAMQMPECELEQFELELNDEKRQF